MIQVFASLGFASVMYFSYSFSVSGMNPLVTYLLGFISLVLLVWNIQLIRKSANRSRAIILFAVLGLALPSVGLLNWIQQHSNQRPNVMVYEFDGQTLRDSSSMYYGKKVSQDSIIEYVSNPDLINPLSADSLFDIRYYFLWMKGELYSDPLIGDNLCKAVFMHSEEFVLESDTFIVNEYRFPCAPVDGLKRLYYAMDIGPILMEYGLGYRMLFKHEHASELTNAFLIPTQTRGSNPL